MVDYLYDCSDVELEQWVILSNRSLRTTFGRIKSPVFKVLSRNENKLLNLNNHESTHEDMTLADIFNYRNKHFNQEKSGKIGFQR